MVNAFNVTCQTCSQIFVGCNTCLSNVACTRCNAGYFLSNSVCNLCAVRNIFCIQCSSDGSVCTQCSFPFILANGLCTSAVISSIIGGSSSSGANNTQGNATTNGTVVDTSNFVTLANGSRVAPVFDRNGCNQIQVFFLGRCLKAIANCVFYQPNGLCGYCTPGHLVTIFGDCSVNNRILGCENGFWLNRKLDVCVKVSPACDWYYPNNGSCINCSRGYNFANNSCVMNQTCNSQQYFYEGACINVPVACASFTNNGTCTKCIDGYSLNGTICRTNPSKILNGNTCSFPCQTCLDFNKAFCFSCVIYYSLKDARYGSCVAVPS